MGLKRDINSKPNVTYYNNNLERGPCGVELDGETMKY
jgi:hypothetical protein